MSEPITQRWATPREMVRAVEAHIGRPFDLDAAAEPASTVAPRYYSITKSGLEHPWDGTAVWCNPPYRKIWPWVDKAAFEISEGRADLVVMLLPARLDTRWAHSIFEASWSVYLIQGRVKFCRPLRMRSNQTGTSVKVGCSWVVLSEPMVGNREGSILVFARKSPRWIDHVDGRAPPLQSKIAGRWIHAEPRHAGQPEV